LRVAEQVFDIFGFRGFGDEHPWFSALCAPMKSRVPDKGIPPERASRHDRAHGSRRLPRSMSRNLDFNKRRQALKAFCGLSCNDFLCWQNHDQQTPQGHSKESAHSLKSMQATAEGGGRKLKEAANYPPPSAVPRPPSPRVTSTRSIR
jgi:hypothetical protein